MRYTPFVNVLCLLTATALAQEPAEDSNPLNDDALVQELRALRLEVAALTAQIETLESEMSRLREGLADQRDRPPRPRHPFMDDEGGGPNVDALSQIQLRPGASPAEVREYVSSIVRASAKQNMFSDRDPQVEMLTRIGPANLPILLEFLAGGPFGSGDYYVRQAASQLAGDEHRDLILAKLPFHHELVEIITRNQWEEDARPILLLVLEKRPQYLPQGWIEAVVRLRDPSTYEALKAHLIEGNNRWQTFETLRELKDLSLDDAVAQAWDRARYDQNWERDSMASIAVEYGHLDALEHVATQIRAGTAEDFQLRQMQRALVQHVAEKGSVRQVADWVLTNKDRLTWDATVKEFRLK